ncbi:hypothetical protein GCM10010345_93680 [Streptomyces canarius]|uniref:Uncharacterized protein n=1 Tax=Streptomyces canarius TaxID=285453 RepID=A0ABQ3DHA5_9ACTN|nr:hypothetical protein GCM10010345_93680 [Streptomyces canarius]
MADTKVVLPVPNPPDTRILTPWGRSSSGTDKAVVGDFPLIMSDPFLGNALSSASFPFTAVPVARADGGAGS